MPKVRTENEPVRLPGADCKTLEDAYPSKQRLKSRGAMWEAEGRGVTGRNPAERRHLCAGGILELKGSANPLMSSASVRR